MGPLVSIIIPCFNAERTIADAIDSALRQTYSPIEVIVVNDGSVDDSVSVLKSYGNKIIVESISNSGACKARNLGLQIAKGRFVQFLDADDLLLPNKVADQIAAGATANSVTYGEWFYQTLDGAYRTERFDSVADPIQFLIRNPKVSTPNPLHTIESLREIGGFREDLRGSQEFDLHLRLAENGVQFRYLPGARHIVRESRGSISSNYMRTMGEQLKILPSLIERLTNTKQLSDERAFDMARYCTKMGRTFVRMGDLERAREFHRISKFCNSPAGTKSAYGWGTWQVRAILGEILADRVVCWLTSSRRSRA